MPRSCVSIELPALLAVRQSPGRRRLLLFEVLDKRDDQRPLGEEHQST